MIEQQLYTRSSCGITLRGPGHDTVAASPGLSKDDLILLNGKCSYYKGNLLTSTGEKIPIVSRTVLDDGRIMFTKTVQRSYFDTSGLKKTFLSHSFLFMPDSKEGNELVCDVRNLSDTSMFITSYDESTDSKTLPALSEFPVCASSNKYGALALLFENKMLDEQFLKNLIYAVMASHGTNRPVILFNSDFDNENMAILFVQAIYSFMPFEWRKSLTFLSFQCDNNVDVTNTLIFAHPDNRQRLESHGMLFDTPVNDCFVFDIKTKRTIFGRFDVNLPDNSYYKYVTSNIGNVSNLEGLFAFFGQILKRVRKSNLEVGDLGRITDIWTSPSESNPISTEGLRLMTAAYNSILSFRTDENSAEVDKLLIAAYKRILEFGGVVCNQVFNSFLTAVEKMDTNRHSQMVPLIFESLNRYSPNNISEDFFAQMNSCLNIPTISHSIISMLTQRNPQLCVLFIDRLLKDADSLEKLLDIYHQIDSDKGFKDEKGQKFSEKDSVLSIFSNKMQSLFCAIPKTGYKNGMVEVSGKKENISRESMHNTIFNAEKDIALLNSRAKEFSGEKVNALIKKELLQTVENLLLYFANSSFNIGKEEMEDILNAVRFAKMLKEKLSKKAQDTFYVLSDFLEVIKNSECMTSIESSKDNWIEEEINPMLFDYLRNYYENNKSSIMKKDYCALLSISYNHLTKSVDFAKFVSYLESNCTAYLQVISWLCHYKISDNYNNPIFYISFYMDTIGRGIDLTKSKGNCLMMFNCFLYMTNILKMSGCSKKELKNFVSLVTTKVKETSCAKIYKTDFKCFCKQISNILFEKKFAYFESTVEKGSIIAKSKAALDDFLQRKFTKITMIVISGILVLGVLVTAVQHTVTGINCDKLLEKYTTEFLNSETENARTASERMSNLTLSIGNAADFIQESLKPQPKQPETSSFETQPAIEEKSSENVSDSQNAYSNETKPEMKDEKMSEPLQSETLTTQIDFPESNKARANSRHKNSEVITEKKSKESTEEKSFKDYMILFGKMEKSNRKASEKKNEYVSTIYIYYIDKGILMYEFLLNNVYHCYATPNLDFFKIEDNDGYTGYFKKTSENGITLEAMSFNEAGEAIETQTQNENDKKDNNKETQYDSVVFWLDGNGNFLVSCKKANWILFKDSYRFFHYKEKDENSTELDKSDADINNNLPEDSTRKDGFDTTESKRVLK